MTTQNRNTTGATLTAPAMTRTKRLLTPCLVLASFVSFSILVANSQAAFVPLPSATALISIDFVRSNPGPQSGDVTHSAGLAFTGQTGDWNSLAVPNGGGTYSQDHNTTQTTGLLNDGDGNTTSAVFTFNPPTVESYHTTDNGPVVAGNGVRENAVWFDGTAAGPLDWEISGLLPGNSYDMIFYGYGSGATHTIFGGSALSIDTEQDSNVSGIVANGSGLITGTVARTGNNQSVWTGLQIAGTGPPPVPVGTLTPYTGGDVGEGLDLTGNKFHAFNLGETSGNQQVQDAIFVPASVPGTTGIAVTGGTNFDYIALHGTQVVEYGGSSSDDALESIVGHVWYGGDLTIDLAVTPGITYQLQLILAQSYIAGQGISARDFDIFVETESPSTLSLAVDNLDIGTETNGVGQLGDDFGLVYTYTFTATDNTFSINLKDNPGGDTFGHINAVTLEEVPIPEPTSLTLAALGLFGLISCGRRRKR